MPSVSLGITPYVVRLHILPLVRSLPLPHSFALPASFAPPPSFVCLVVQSLKAGINRQIIIKAICPITRSFCWLDIQSVRPVPDGVHIIDNPSVAGHPIERESWITILPFHNPSGRFHLVSKVTALQVFRGHPFNRAGIKSFVRGLHNRSL